MALFSEDFTAGKLKGIPVFCVNRVYKYLGGDVLAKHRYRFEFDNGLGASIIEFNDRRFSSGHRYELAVFNGNGDICNTILSDIIERGDERYMLELLNKIEALHNLDGIIPVQLCLQS